MIQSNILLNLQRQQYKRCGKLFFNLHNSINRKASIQRLCLSSFPSSSFLNFLPEVSDALSSSKGGKKPVVALESTIIAHGMPYPTNLELMKDLSDIFRSKEVIPAIIAIKNGVPHIGLTEEEILDLSQSGQEGRATKVTTRDLPFLMASGGSKNGNSHEGKGHVWGATTVASTMHLAHLAGISTFVTGGTGGVHRGGELSLDISSDLTELSKTPVVVISAGIKSILDIQKTLETLETLSVPTATYQSDEYPSFFSPHSGIQTPHRVENATEVANVFLTSKYKLKLSSGMLIAVPNTHPAGQAVENAIQESLNEVKELQIVGKDVTPYILKAVSEKTKGESLLSNIELVKRNAKIGADIAIAICKEENKFQEEEKDSNELHSELQEDESNTPSPSTVSSPSSKVIVMGGIVMDLIAKPKKGLKLILSTSNPGICFESDGGVGRNIAEVLGRLGAKPLLYSAIGGSSTSSSSGGGGDSIGQAMIARLTKECGVVVSPDSIHVASSSKNNDDTNNTHKNINSTRTATYLAILDHNSDLNVAIADMDIFQHIPIPSTEILQQADALVLDANPPLQSLVKAAINATSSTSTTTTKVFLDPTSVPKARIIGTCDELLKCISYAFPNLDELLAMADGWTDTNAELNEAKQDGLKTIKLASEELLKQMDPTEAHLIITLGCDGVMLASKKKKESNNNTKEKRKEFEFIHFPAKEGVNVENSTGAGDTLCGAFINGILNGKSERESVQIGMDAAILSLQCPDRAISPKLGRHF